MKTLLSFGTFQVFVHVNKQTSVLQRHVADIKYNKVFVLPEFDVQKKIGKMEDYMLPSEKQMGEMFFIVKPVEQTELIKTVSVEKYLYCRCHGEFFKIASLTQFDDDINAQ